MIETIDKLLNYKINHRIKNAIMIYLFILTLFSIKKPDIFTDNNTYLPVVIIIVSSISYYAYVTITNLFN